MWPKLLSRLKRYPTFVLTGLDPEGYPYSVRCTPEPDSATESLRLTLPDYVKLQSGPACLLGHYHDDQLWNQTNVMIRGKLERAGDVWLFRLIQAVEGAGAGMSLLRQIREGRSAAQRYLQKRGLTRPKIPWDKLKAIYKGAQAK